MTTPLDVVLARVEHAREVAPGRWRACCPAHGGKNRSTLAVTAGDDGRVLMNCKAGCEFVDVVQAMGLEARDLFPPKPTVPGGGAPPMRHPFVPAQVFEVVRFEVAVVYVIAGDMRRDRAISEADFDRLGVAIGRIADVAGAYHRGR